MKAVILAGGEGTRLRPLTSNQPKPMMPIANVPMMEHIVKLLARHGFDDIVVTVAFMANHIRTYFGDGSELGVRMRYATEEAPLGTAGSVRNAMAELDETFLVISGDVLTDVDLGAIVEQHNARQRVRDDRVEAGREPGRLRHRHHPRGRPDRAVPREADLGRGVLRHDQHRHLRARSRRVRVHPRRRGRRLLRRRVPGRARPRPAAPRHGRRRLLGRRRHAGVVPHRAREPARRPGRASSCPGFQLREGVWIGEGVDVSPDAIIQGPVLVGDNSRVEAGAVLAPYTVLGADVVVKADAHLERTVVHDHCYIGHSARLRGAVIGRGNDIREHAHIEEGVVIGDECFVGARAIISPGVKIYPFKTVEAGALVTSSIVWESKGARTLFGRRGVRGLANVDITSEVAVRLAMAYGTALKKGSVVCTSRDTSRVARALKRAIIAGLNLSGVHVMDLELSTVPVTRFQVRSERAQGGISVRLAPDDPDSVEIRFFDEKGADIDETQQRKLERLLYREDFRRAFAADIGDIMFPPRALEFYTAALEASVDGERLRQPLVQGRARLLVRRRVGRHAARARQDRRVGARGQPVRGDGRRDGRRPRDAREDHGRPRAHVGLRSRPRLRPRRRDRGDHRRRGHRAHCRPGAAR